MLNIETTLRWSPPVQTRTVNGDRLLRTAAPDAAFWGLWRSRKAELIDSGVSVRKDGSGEWQACWWLNIDGSCSVLRKSAVPASVAQFGDAVEAPSFIPQQEAALRASVGVPETILLETSSAVNWSAEQVAIFAEAKTGKSNFCVTARAGTGKTTTIKEAFTHAPEASMLYVVFNKKNQREAESKISDLRVDIKTLHALGFSYIKDVWPLAVPDDVVEWDRIKAAAGSVTLPDDISGIVHKLVGFAKNCCVGVPTVADLVSILEEQGLMADEESSAQVWTAGRVAALALSVLQLSVAEDSQHRISFNDMVWLPVACDWVHARYDLVVVDEAQDMNLVQLEMAIRACRKTGRLGVVGDDRQAIYGFRGAAADGLNYMANRLQAKRLSLSTTYRCPKRVVAVAQRIVPDYNAADSAPEGIVDECCVNDLVSMLRPGDAVLSRINAPLMPVCLALLRQGVPARIEGRDIGKQLSTIVRKLRAKSIPDFLRKLAAWCSRSIKRAEAAGGRGADAKIGLITDQHATLVSVAEGLSSVDEVEARLASLFSDSDKDCRPRVVLSSVHKAKGLEWDHVYLLAGTFGRGAALTEGEESNIYYVAVTRAKKHLTLAG